MSARQDRIAKGLCPQCGKEAAPYYLCGDCRFKELLGRFLRKATKVGALKREQHGRLSYWSALDRSKFDDVDYREVTRADDKRLRPRLKGIPVDVESELLSIFDRAARPLHIDEIYAAWGRMRLRSGRESAAGDLARIVEGRRKQEKKLERRAARHQKQLAAQERAA